MMAPVGAEMSPQLEASVNEMTRCLKSLFSVMFCTSRGEPSISEQQLATISQIKGMLQSQLADFEDYLLVKGQRNVTMTAYPFFSQNCVGVCFLMIRNGFPALDFPALEPLASLYFLPVISLFIFVRIFTFAEISYGIHLKQ